MAVNCCVAFTGILAEVGETETETGGGGGGGGALVPEPQSDTIVAVKSPNAIARSIHISHIRASCNSFLRNGGPAKWFSNSIPSSLEQAINCEFILGADIHLSVNDSRHDEFHRLAGLISREILIAVVQFAAQVRRVKCSQNSRLTSAV